MAKERSTRTITVYLSPVEMEKLERCVALKHLTKSEVVRMGLWKMFDEYLPEQIEPELDYIIEQKVNAVLKERGLL